ncbi:MAG: NUDIX hydrolase [Gordonibacter sp.]|nr:NUDIX hydrolase [Gordonibacter sp.]
MSLRHDILAYQPFNEQEAVDRQVILQQLACNPHVFDRTSPAHLTCSLWTIDTTHSRTLMVHHNLYHSWSWIGGHADGQQDLASVALRELTEETGVEDVRLVSCGPGDLYSLEALTVDGHVKHGSYVSSHLHLNVTYLGIASPDTPLRIKPDENSRVKWIDLDEVCKISSEPWMAEHIYRKLIDKLGSINLPLK